MSGPRLVLASASPRRLAILRQLGLDAAVSPADVDETPHPDEPPEAHVERLALAKASWVRAREPGTLVIAGDTIVVRDGEILGKPRDAAEAEAMLLSLSGRAHEVMSGVALAWGEGTTAGVARASVRFRAFDRAAARAYVSTGEPMDKAGAYGIQGLGAALVDEVAGDYNAVVGLPVALLIALLARAGWRYEFGRLRPTV